MAAPLNASAPAKINLTLRVGRRRADGLHEIESLVVFAEVADRLSLEAGRPLGLGVMGPLRSACGPAADNLVIKAARALQEQMPALRLGHFILFKRIPVAAGLGGGSADAAAALRLLAKANRLALDDARLLEAARQTGADVSVCLDPQPRLMRGIGERLSAPLMLPRLPAVLVNPGVALPTKDVFAAFDSLQNGSSAPLQEEPNMPGQRAALVDWLRERPNDLEAAAISVQPAVGKVLKALRALRQCRLARMSGSGATCFALCDSAAAATAAARALRVAQPRWWIRATSIGAGQ